MFMSSKEEHILMLQLIFSVEVRLHKKCVTKQDVHRYIDHGTLRNILVCQTNSCTGCNSIHQTEADSSNPVLLHVISLPVMVIQQCVAFVKSRQMCIWVLSQNMNRYVCVEFVLGNAEDLDIEII